MKRIMGFIRDYKRNEQGATAVEFALVALPFLLMMFGVMEAGRIVWIMNSIQYSVEETCRYASLNSDLPNEDFQDYAEAKLREMRVPVASFVVTTSTETSNGVDFIQVDGDYELSTMLNGLLPGDFGNFDYDVSARKPVIN